MTAEGTIIDEPGGNSMTRPPEDEVATACWIEIARVCDHADPKGEVSLILMSVSNGFWAKIKRHHCPHTVWKKPFKVPVGHRQGSKGFVNILIHF